MIFKSVKCVFAVITCLVICFICMTIISGCDNSKAKPDAAISGSRQSEIIEESGSGDMNEKDLIVTAYKQMYDGMINKDETILNEVLDDSFVLVHMTGMQQSKKEFIEAVKNGTLNYYSAEHEYLPVEINGDTAVLTGQSYVAASVFGGGRNNWHLQQKCSMKKTDGQWKITRSIASTY